MCLDCLKEIGKSRTLFNNQKDSKRDAISIHPIYWNQFTNLYEFTSKIQELIHSLKYESNHRIIKFLIQFGMNNQWKMLLNNYTLILPIPLFHARRRERGFNQSSIIGKHIAKLFSKPFNNKLLKRIKFTPTQTQKNREERLKNITSAFICSQPQKIRGKNIVLIDDVLTTGSTANECCKQMKYKGTGKIWVITLAQAILNKGN